MLSALSKTTQNPKTTSTTTWGDQVENHAGMIKHGVEAKTGEGFNLEDFTKYQEIIENMGATATIVNLKDYLPEELHAAANDAYILYSFDLAEKILENTNHTLNSLYLEQLEIDWDRKYYDTRRKKVLNKHARGNVCYDNEPIEPDYENKQGRVISWESIPGLNIINKKIGELFGEKVKGMPAEGNHYFDLKKCGIGWHGDSERRKVLALRLGAEMDMNFHWWHRCKRIGERFSMVLPHGSVYLMSEWAVGTKWRSSSLLTLRHSAGSEKYTK